VFLVAINRGKLLFIFLDDLSHILTRLNREAVLAAGRPRIPNEIGFDPRERVKLDRASLAQLARAQVSKYAQSGFLSD